MYHDPECIWNKLRLTTGGDRVAALVLARFTWKLSIYRLAQSVIYCFDITESYPGCEPTFDHFQLLDFVTIWEKKRRRDSDKKHSERKQNECINSEFCLCVFIRPEAISASGDMKVNLTITLTNCRLESSHKASL